MMVDSTEVMSFMGMAGGRKSGIDFKNPHPGAFCPASHNT
jgi:hypothetical protein